MGSLNKATIEIRTIARELIGDVKYLARVRQRLHDGTIQPVIEALLWHYAWGKPPAFVETPPEQPKHDYSKLSDADLNELIRLTALVDPDAHQTAADIEPPPPAGHITRGY